MNTLNRSNLVGKHKWQFLLGVWIDALGSGLFLPFSLLYFTNVARLPLAAVGGVLTIAMLLSLPMTPLAGMLVDRIGARQVILISMAFAALSCLGYLFVRTIPLLALTTLPGAIAGRLFWVALPTFIASISTEGKARDSWYGLVGVAQNAGNCIGGALAGLLVAFGGTIAYQVILYIDVVSFLLAMVCIWGLPVREAPVSTSIPLKSPIGHGGYRAVLRDKTFLGILVSGFVFVLCLIMLSDIVPYYLVNVLHLPSWIVGVEATFSAILLTLQALIVRLVISLRRTRILILAGWVWIGSGGLFLLALIFPSGQLILYILLVVGIYTCGGLLYGPAMNALVAEVGPGSLRSRYIATYQFAAWGLGQTIAPTLFASLFTLGPAYPWIVLIGLCLFATLLLYRLEARDPRLGESPRAFQQNGIDQKKPVHS
ncbi:MFS transporter [Reticulibacter mediterranei]|uniref:MFS transporter n=1 Tax=Reticulibacter mediterranei TaxID=2778369 RepID=A0A8J3IY58_9CHLR|nr:MFS transporter [Reticulibacter mediterranei]GHO98925.1 MFS transporter [Reticulibacter mediterranei]